MKIQIINGPNLNLLAEREAIYGNKSLDDIKSYTENKLKQCGNTIELNWFQSNIEGEIVEKIQSLRNLDYKGLIINPAAYSHTSVAIYDALKLLNMSIIEVHLTNVYQREHFRQRMLTAQAADMIMGGLGINAYYLGALSILES